MSLSFKMNSIGQFYQVLLNIIDVFITIQKIPFFYSQDQDICFFTNFLFYHLFSM